MKSKGYSDGEAISKAHMEANFHNLPVKAGKENGEYHIGNIKNIEVSTDTDLQGANIHIDESLTSSGDYIYKIQSSNIQTFDSSKGEVDTAILTELLDILINKEKSVYFQKYNNYFVTVEDSDLYVAARYDRNGNRIGRYTYKEHFAIDNNKMFGEIYFSPNEYSAVPNKATIYKLDSPIKIKNCNFILSGSSDTENTLNKPRKYILVERSNVTMENISVKIKPLASDEGDIQRVFFHVVNNYNTLLKNINGLNFKAPNNSLYTYFIEGNRTVKLTIDNLQTKLNENDKWGAIGTHYCKNMTMINTTTSRFDSHFYGADITIENCELGFQGNAIGVDGYGTLNIRNVIGHGYWFFRYRTDYGGFWGGDINIEDCTLNFIGDDNHNVGSIIRHTNFPTYDYYREVVLADSINIRNFKVIDKTGKMVKTEAITLENRDGYTMLNGNKTPMILPSKISIDNIVSEGTPIDIISVTGDYSQKSPSTIDVKNVDFKSVPSNKYIAANEDGISVYRKNNLKVSPYEPNIYIDNCENIMIGFNGANGSILINNSVVNRINTSENSNFKIENIEIKNSKLNANLKPMSDTDLVYYLKAKNVLLDNVIYNIPKINNNNSYNYSLLYRSGIFNEQQILDNINCNKFVINSNFANYGTVSNFLKNSLNGYISRGRFVQMINQKFKFTAKGNINYTDVPTNHPYYNDIAIACKSGYIATSSTKFRPDDWITREEIASIITSITDTKDTNTDKLNRYTDASNVSDWAKSSVEGSIEHGYMGVDSETFLPKDKALFKEIGIIIDRVYASSKNTNGSVLIKYVNNDGTIISEEKIVDLALKEHIYKAKTIEGYEPVGELSKSTNLTVGNPSRTLVFMYKKITDNSEGTPTPIKGTVTVRYLNDTTGEKILEEEVTQDLDLGIYMYNSKTIVGYRLIGNDLITTQITEQNLNPVIEFRYTKIVEPEPEITKGSIIIKYLDENGTTLADEEVKSDLVLGEYTYVAKAILGYEIIGETSKTVVLTNENLIQTIEFRYSKTIESKPEIKGSIIIKYLDENGTTLADEEVKSSLDLGEYTYKAKDISGYVIIGDTSKTTILTKENPNQIIQFRYKRSTIENIPNEDTLSGSILVKYINKRTGMDIQNPKLIEDVTIGVNYKVEYDVISGYDITKEDAFTVCLSQENPSIEIVFNYLETENIVDRKIKRDSLNDLVSLNKGAKILLGKQTIELSAATIEDISIKTTGDIVLYSTNIVDFEKELAELLKNNDVDLLSKFKLFSTIDNLNFKESANIVIDAELSDNAPVYLYKINADGSVHFIDKSTVINGSFTTKIKDLGNYFVISKSLGKVDDVVNDDVNIGNTDTGNDIEGNVNNGSNSTINGSNNVVADNENVLPSTGGCTLELLYISILLVTIGVIFLVFQKKHQII